MIITLSLALALVTSADVVSRDIHAEPAMVAFSTRGLVVDARPRIDYDFAALQLTEDARAVFKLGYDGLDGLALTASARTIDTAHGLAAEIVRTGDAAPPATIAATTH